MSKRKKNKFFVPPPIAQIGKPKIKFAPGKIGYYDKKPVFSFTYYFDEDKSWSFRCVKDCSKFYILFRNLLHMSQLTWSAIIQTGQFCAHEIDDPSRLPSCIQNHFKKKKITELSPFQFKAFDEKSRIIGVFTHKAVFEIICLDISHKIYPSQH